MSSLPATNGETAKEMLRRAQAAYRGADFHCRAGQEHWELACRDYVYAAELTLKAVYVKHEQPFERTHNIWELYQNCPEPSRPLGGFTGPVMQEFSTWYPAPYFIGRQATTKDLTDCQDVSARIVGWAEKIIHDNF